MFAFRAIDRLRAAQLIPDLGVEEVAADDRGRDEQEREQPRPDGDHEAREREHHEALREREPSTSARSVWERTFASIMDLIASTGSRVSSTCASTACSASS